jgi:hypothetical protein
MVAVPLHRDTVPASVVAADHPLFAGASRAASPLSMTSTAATRPPSEEAVGVIMTN